MKKLVLNLIRFYQQYLSFDQGLPKKAFPRLKMCRFTPTCSQYAYEAIKKYGLFRGGKLGIWRLVRCNPFSSGGFDPVI